MKQIYNSREIAAYRESGKAVMLFLFKQSFDSIEINCDGTGAVNYVDKSPTSLLEPEFKQSLSAGSIEYVKNDLEKTLKRYTMIKMAGLVSEFKLLRRRMPEGFYFSEAEDKNDYSIQNQIFRANQFLAETRFGKLQMYLWEKQTITYLKKPKVWEAVKELATTLIDQESGKLNYAEGNNILSKHLRTYRHKQ